LTIVLAMSFGWAPPEELLNQGREKKIDFFTRLEADRQCTVLLRVRSS